MDKKKSHPPYTLTIDEISEDGVIAYSTARRIKPKREQINRCKKWLELFAEPYEKENAWNFRQTSYNFKHAVERWSPSVWPDRGNYVTNGAFIVAALEMKYKARPTKGGLPDAYFNIRLKVSKKDWNAWRAAGFLEW